MTADLFFKTATIIGTTACLCLLVFGTYMGEWVAVPVALLGYLAILALGVLVSAIGDSQ
jgi:hypothetical protein